MIDILGKLIAMSFLAIVGTVSLVLFAPILAPIAIGVVIMVATVYAWEWLKR